MSLSFSLRDLLSAGFCRAEWTLRRREDSRRMNELRRLERAGEEEILELQSVRLRRLLEHAARTPYYREALEKQGLSARDVRSPQDLRVVPVLTKRILQDRLTDLVDPAAAPRDRLRRQSGGSTGAPTVFYHDRGFWHAFHGASWLGLEWCGYRPGDRQTYLWGADFDAPPRTWRVALRQYLENNLFENAFQMSEDRLEAYVRRLTRWRPEFLWSYVSSALELARFARERSLKVRFRAVRTTAETLTPAQREVLESAFGCALFDQYGSRELGMVAHECEAHRGLHVFSPHHWVEILPVEEDTAGRLVVTDLTNRALPFLRYDTGDLARWAEGACPCGRSWPRLERIIGRVSDVLIAPSGKRIHGEFFTHLFYKLDGVRQFQVVQEDGRRLRFRIVFSAAGEQPRERARRFLREKILEFGDPRFLVEFEDVDEIPPSPSGKHRFTICNLEL